MYLPFYGLAEKPFAITPDPRYLFLSERHAEALAHLVYGISEAGGFIQLTGEVGTGKTTIIRSLLARLPDNAEIALILNPQMQAAEFVLTICEELGIMVPDDAVGSVKELVDILNRYLLRAHAAGKRVVLVVDEAQNLAPELLEQVRMLTNLETETQKLLQIILIGQPELRDLLARNDLRQLAQRITGRYHLEPLTRDESAAYVKHRLRIAGAKSDIFTSGALRELYRTGGGVPRLLNIIGDRALLGGYSEDQHEISAAMVRRAAGEVFDRRVLAGWWPWALGSATALVVAGALIVGALLWQEKSAQPESGNTATVTEDTVNEEAAAPPDPVAPTAIDIPPPSPLAALLNTASADDGPAWDRLFMLWSARYLPDAAQPCDQALRQGLECLEQSTGSIALLRQFNRPAIMLLSGDDGAHRSVVLQRLDADRAQIQVGRETSEVPLAELERRWNGHYTLLWRPRQLDTRDLSMGMSGEPVRDLRARLRQWSQLPPESPPGDLYDAALKSLVQQFQSLHGLAADGIAGIQTQVLLDATLAATGTPLLAAKIAGG
ncbi:MAG: AAA family ATPase [Nevskiaceae bacterium]|jgi:general secretion pathway protein A|nr:AAA family ATPase [Nevskiaceae bacterium]